MSVLRAARMSRKLSQHKAAERCGVSQEHLSRIETGKARPSLVCFQRICVGLGMTGEERLAALDELGSDATKKAA